MSMAKQIFYHNLKKGNKTEAKIYERDIRPFEEKERFRKLNAVCHLLYLLQKIEIIKNKLINGID